jgi:hypothetical protein
MLSILYEVFSKINKNAKGKQNTKFLDLVKKYFNPSILNNTTFPNKVNLLENSGGAPQQLNSRYLPYQYRQPLVTSYIKNNQNNPNNINVQEPNRTNISYYITINMELQKGTTLTTSELSNIKCKQRWNAIRKSYANMRGLAYTTLPDYSLLPKNKTFKNTVNAVNEANTRKNFKKPITNSGTQKNGFRLGNNRTRKSLM